MPLLPKTPLLRFTSSETSRHSLVSISSGVPIQKWSLSSAQNTRSMSRSEACETAEKWDGTVLAGCGPSKAIVGSSTSATASIGSTWMVPKAAVPDTTWAMYGSETSGGVAARLESVEPRETSVTTPKKRSLSPWMLTKVPTFISSVLLSASSLTSTPSVSEPATTMPSFVLSRFVAHGRAPPRGPTKGYCVTRNAGQNVLSGR